MEVKEILAMKAGKELDASVAKLLGVPIFQDKHGKWLVRSGIRPLCRTPNHYSTDISAAWQVWLAVTKDAPEDWAIYSDSNGEVTVEHYPNDYKGDREMGCGDFEVDGPFPEAICKAALLANLEGGQWRS